jgi:hypothetical protein
MPIHERFPSAAFWRRVKKAKAKKLKVKAETKAEAPEAKPKEAKAQEAETWMGWHQGTTKHEKDGCRCLVSQSER